MPDSSNPLTIVRAYHETTKHHPHRYARALGYMDWDTQPDPFRRYEGAARVALLRPEPTPEPTYSAIHLAGAVPSAPLHFESLSQFFFDSLALSAWKQFKGSRWSLRVNPSSGNLHPTEGYLICGAIEGLGGPGVHHYLSFDHALERRRDLPASLWDRLASDLPAGAVLVGLTSIYWRESWKYGERAFRYCQHDVGHAIGAVALAAGTLGWEARLLASLDDGEIARLLGIHGQEGIEAEHPDAIMALFPAGARFPLELWRDYRIEPDAREEIASGPWHGAPNCLSVDHHHWEVIDVASEASARAGPPGEAFWRPSTCDNADLAALPPGPPARRIIRQRRSAVDMDGATSISRESFYRMMLAVMPGRDQVAFRALPWAPRIHLGLFVHRVEDLEPGLYALVRLPEALEPLRSSMKKSFAWVRPDGCPRSLGLYFLQAADCRRAAAGVSCGQDIAADGAFALGMLGFFDGPLQELGPWLYRCLHWEAGVIGQILYLEAEAAGVRSTGIGCFFDDVMHGVLGIEGTRLQTLYHFTVGGPVEDTRLQTIAAYAHLESGSSISP